MGELPSDGSPMVTVIVLTYDHAQFVAQAVGSVLAQDTPWPIRVIVHDDASSDETPEILRRLAIANPGRLELRLRDTNVLSTGVNPSVEILRDVTTPYVAWCEGDDWWTDPHKLRRQVEFMQDNDWCSVVHHDVETVVEDGGSDDYASHLRKLLAQPWRREQRLPGVRIAHGNFIMTCSAMVRRSRLRERALAAVFDVQPGDFVTFALALEDGDIGFIPESMAAYRIHGGNFWARPRDDRTGEEQRALWFLAAYAVDPMRSEVRDILTGRATPRADREPATGSDSTIPQGAAEHDDLAVACGEATELADENALLREERDALVGSRGWRLLERARRVRAALGSGGRRDAHTD